MLFSVIAQTLSELSSEKFASLVKSTMSQACSCVKFTTVETPVADEALLDKCRRLLGGQYVLVPIHDMTGLNSQAQYLSVKETAYIDASAVLKASFSRSGFDVTNTSSLGVGEMMAAALGAGHSKLVVFLGETDVTDLGAGLASACGLRFVARNGQYFIPTGRTFIALNSVIVSNLYLSKDAPKITVMCDTMNSLIGQEGALEAWRKDDRADNDNIACLEANIKLLNNILKQANKKVARDPGTGAAYGMTAIMKAFMNAQLKNKAEFLAKLEDTPSANEASEVTHSDWAIVACPSAHLPDAKDRFKGLLANAHADRIIVVTDSGLAESEWLLSAGANHVLANVTDERTLVTALKNMVSLMKSMPH